MLVFTKKVPTDVPGCPKNGHNRGGEEGVKWELGFVLFLTGKLGLAFLGLGYLKVGMGNKILKWDWDT